MAHDTEILVHIAAPSTTKDDIAYRSLAAAYLDFEPGRRTTILPLATLENPGLPPEELISPQASFKSVWDNVRTAPTRPFSQQSQHGASHDGGTSQDTWVAPPSEVADSMPDNDISIAGFTTPTRVLNYFLQTMGPPSEASPGVARRHTATVYEGDEDYTALVAVAQERTALSEAACTPRAAAGKEEPGSLQRTVNACRSTPETRDTTTSEDRLDENHPNRTPSSPLRSRNLPPQEAPFSQALRDESSSPPAQSSQQSSADSYGVIIPSTQLPERADSEPPSSKRQRPNPLQEKAHGLGRSISDVLPRGSMKSTVVAKSLPDNVAAPGPQVLDWSHLTEIVSIEPPPANHKLGPRPPVHLETFVRKVGMEGRYRPKFQARAMRPYERGYWLLDMDGWTREARVATWGFLGNYIRRDSKAGWGTRACRDEQWSWIRLYGWEHIAGELYILLYVASYRRMKRMTVTWYDGAGKELIIVGARSGDNSTLE